MPFGMASECPPPWVSGVNELDPLPPCPYGKKLFGDVTLPNDTTAVDYLAVSVAGFAVR